MAGSSRNETTGTAGGAEEAAADDVGPRLSAGVSPGVASGDGRGVTADFGCPVGSGWRRDAEGPGRLGFADAAAGRDADGELAGDGSANGEPGIGDSGAGDSGAAIVTAGASDVGLPAGSTELPRIWSTSQAEKTDAWSVVSWRAFASPTRQT